MANKEKDKKICPPPPPPIDREKVKELNDQKQKQLKDKTIIKK